jgi:hypothetical protein
VFGAHVAVDVPADHHAGAQVDHGGQIQPALARFQVGDVPAQPGAGTSEEKSRLPFSSSMWFSMGGLRLRVCSVVFFHARVRTARRPCSRMMAPTVGWKR